MYVPNALSEDSWTYIFILRSRGLHIQSSIRIVFVYNDVSSNEGY